MVYKLPVSAPPEAEHWVWQSQKPLRAHFECIFKLGHSNEWDLPLSLFFGPKFRLFCFVPPSSHLGFKPQTGKGLSVLYNDTHISQRDLSKNWDHKASFNWSWLICLYFGNRASPLASAMASEPRFVLLFKFLNWSSFSNLSARVRLTQVVVFGWHTVLRRERG